MSQRSISSFFQAKPKSGAKVSAEKTKDNKENGSSPPSKENVTPNKSLSNQECSGSIEKPRAGAANTLDSLPETNLDAAVPYRKTAPKPGKRSSDENSLQAQAPKKIKLETENESTKEKEKSPKTIKEASTKIKTKSPKVKEEKKVKKSPKIKEEKVLDKPKESTTSSEEVVGKDEESNSPVKVSRSHKNRIVSDSEDDSPVKAKPESAKQAFSIFAAAKSPVKKPKVEEESPKKSPVKKSPPKSKEKATAKKSSSKEKSPIKDEEKSPKLEKESPKPSTSKEESPVTTKPKNPFQGFFSPKQAGGAKKDSAVGNDYDKMVKKLQYHPVDDAFWKKGDKTPYMALAKTLVAIEETSGRLRTIEILSNYFRSVMVLNPEDLVASVYMITNRLAPAWKGIELGVGESFLIKAIANSTGRNPKQIKEDMLKLGDLGLVAESSKSSQKTMFQPKSLTLEVVFDRLKEVAMMTGTGGTNKKVDKIQQLMVACQGPEARYLIRTLANKLRIGLAEQSVLQALAHACVQTPIGQEFPPKIHTSFKSAESDAFKEKLSAEALKLKTAYCECPTYDLLIPALLEQGIDGLKTRCKLTTGIPLKPMLAHPTKGIQEVLTRFENCKFTCEWKYDGERAQIHLNEDGSINIYSRNQEDNTSKYPDIISRFKNCFSGEVKSAILDCEAVAWDTENKAIKPFQVLSTRKRKDAVESEIKVQVCVFAFDLLYLNGESLVKKNFGERRDLLRKTFKEVEGEFFYAKSIDGTTTEEIQEALDISIKENCEGLMVKTLDHEATYEIARRSRNWLKVKKDYLEGVGDTLDLVVIGGYNGKGKRTGGYGGFLLACYDPENEEYQTICKIGTGFSDEDLQKHAAFFKENVIPQAKGYYSYDPSHAPDQWFEPVQVWEVKCADLSVSPVHKAAMGLVDPSKGVSLRFPRFIRIRDDKSAEAATSSDQIADMYNNQDQIKNQIKNNQKSTEDDFDF